jgi:hypothetical protein
MTGAWPSAKWSLQEGGFVVHAILKSSNISPTKRVLDLRNFTAIY